MLKRVGIVVAAGLVVGLAVLGWAWWQWTGQGPAAPGDVATTLLRIPQGMTLSAAADTLVARGLLADRWRLLLGARLTGQDKGLRAGLYDLAYAQSPRDLLADLTSGLSVQVVVTIPEGLDADEIAAVMVEAFGFEPTRFLAAADSLARAAVQSHGLAGTAAISRLDSAVSGDRAPPESRRFHWCEGLLAPDTYHFAEGTDAVSAAGILVGTQVERLRLAAASAINGRNADLEPLGLLTLASVVEAEARRDDERRRIAAVYTNRLARGWRLEADPTVAFLLDRKGERLYFKHLKIQSPYNTYRRRGLPPGPIGAPGLASLEAAARPDAACDAMYFVSDGADGHIFSRTAREHEEAVARFRAKRARRPGGD